MHFMEHASERARDSCKDIFSNRVHVRRLLERFIVLSFGLSSSMPLNTVLLLLVTSVGKFPLTFNLRSSELSALGFLSILIDFSIELGIAYLVVGELGYDIIQPEPFFIIIHIVKGFRVGLVCGCEFKVRRLVEDDLRHLFFFHRHSLFSL